MIGRILTPRLLEHFYLWIRGRQLGGRLHLYGRVLLRMTDYDFKAASRDGYGDDWPISYADLAPYYDQVEEFMGVYGTQDNIRNLPDGRYGKTPILTEAERAFKAKVEATWPDRSVISWKDAAPNLKRVPLPILAASETGRLTIRTDAIVKRIIVDPTSGKATGAEFIDRLTRRTETVSANVVVLCASTIESVRLLLNSACSKYPNGLANSNGLLGRYFMDQCPSQAYGTLPGRTGSEPDESAPPDAFYGPAGGIYIPRFQNLDVVTNPRFKRGFAFQGAIGRGNVPDDRPAIFGIMGFGEPLPYYENCITLNPKRKDAWGFRFPTLRVRFSKTSRNCSGSKLDRSRRWSFPVAIRSSFLDRHSVSKTRRTPSQMPIGSAGSCSESLSRRAWRLALQFTSVVELAWETIPPSQS